MPNLNGGTKYVELSEALPDIWDGDLLLFRGGTGIISNLIRTYGKGRYSHAGMAAWWDNDLMCLEVRELRGGRGVTLHSQVNKYPGMIDVYRANAKELEMMDHMKERGMDPGPERYDRMGSVRMMRGMTHGQYGYWDILMSFLTHLPGIRMFCKPNFNDDDVDSRPPYCSAAYSIAARLGGGVDPVPDKSDRYTEPSDLSHTSFFKYLLTLTPDKVKT